MIKNCTIYTALEIVSHTILLHNSITFLLVSVLVLLPLSKRHWQIIIKKKLHGSLFYLQHIKHSNAEFFAAASRLQHLATLRDCLDRQTWVSKVYEIENLYSSCKMKQRIDVQILSFLWFNCVELGNKSIGEKYKGNCSLVPGLHQSFQ